MEVSHQLSHKQTSNLIIAGTDKWLVGPNITDIQAWIISKEKDLSEIPKFGWQYYDTKWSEDETLEFR